MQTFLLFSIFFTLYTTIIFLIFPFILLKKIKLTAKLKILIICYPLLIIFVGFDIYSGYKSLIKQQTFIYKNINIGDTKNNVYSKLRNHVKLMHYENKFQKKISSIEFPEKFHYKEFFLYRIIYKQNTPLSKILYSELAWDWLLVAFDNNNKLIRIILYRDDPPIIFEKSIDNKMSKFIE